MSEEIKQQVWQFTESQQLLLREQARQHKNELVPLQQYQENSRNQLLVTFTRELGVPDGAPITVDLDNMQFILQEEATAPVEVPATELPDEAFTPVEELLEPVND